MNPLHQNQGFVSATPQTDLEEGDLTFPVLDQDIDLVTHLEEELDLRIPSFLCDENPTEQTLPGEEENELIFPHLSFLEVEKAFPQVEESLTLPIFDEGIDLVPHTEEELNLHVPSFLYSENLTQLPSTENNLAIPQFSQTKIPYEVSFADEEEATIPELFPIKFPIPTRSLEFRLKIPIFTETKSPRRLTIDFPSLHFPEFVPIQAPGFILPVNSSLLQIPRFFKTRFPRPIFSPLPTPLKEPTFLRIQDPQFRMHEKTFLQRGTLLSQKKERKENEWGIFLQYHPILKNFQKLSSKLSYVDILSQAVQIDSLGDVRAIKKHFIKIQYLNSLFADLLSIAPSVLERSEDANILLENDQPQIDLLTTFCKELVRIDSIESLPFRKHPLIERLIDFKNLMTKGCPPLAFSQLCDKNLLMFKENIFCFLQEILRQELVASKKFGAVQKNMIPLAKRLPHLATHILREKNRLRMQQIRSFASVNFALWEDRTPIDPVPSEPEFTRTPQIPTPQQLNEGLAAIQAERPPVFKLTDFTNQVLSLPERTKREALLKGKYLLEFGKVYCGRFFNPTALKRGIAWIDQAIEVLQKKYKKRNPHLLECYHYRGVAWKKWAEYLKEKESDRDLVRKRVDTCSRDFHASCYLPQEDKTNFVTYLKDSRKIKNNSLALQSIEKAIAGDRDYSEAHYLKFLREFEVLQLDQTRMLHPHFEILKTSTPETIIQKFKAILVKPAHRIYSLFKVTCSARSAYIQFDADKILMSELGLDFLLEMLTQGVKKVRLNPQTKAYFGQTVSQEKLYETVQTLGDSKKRLKEIERGLHTFHTFELAAFYKATVLNEETTLDCRWARQKLAPGLLRNSISLDACAMDAHFREGKKLNSPQHFVCALIFACRAIEACNQFLSHSEEETIYTKRLELIVERALIYKSLNLKNCCVSDLEKAMALGKKRNHRYVNPSLHSALETAHEELERLEATKQSQSEEDIFIEFQDQNIQNECIQVLRDHYEANAQVYPHRKVPYWDDFIVHIGKTATFKDFCENLFSYLLLTEKVVPDHLLRIAKLANIHLRSMDPLDQVKNYAKDAVQAYQEEEEKLQDAIIVKLKSAETTRKREEEFYRFKLYLTKKLRKGERIRPGSTIADKILNLTVHLQSQQFEVDYIVGALREILEKKEGEDNTLNVIREQFNAAEEVQRETAEEIAEILENALNRETSSPKVENKVLTLTGNNIFFSQIKDSIVRSCQQDPTIHDVHIIGIQTYIDTDIQLNGINLAIGGEYVEYLKNKGPKGKDLPVPITIDLSGKPGKSGAPVSSGRAADGRNPCDHGTKGLRGNDGEGGWAGGDFCVSASKTLKGFDPSIVAQINLSGGKGGRGSNGQPGGNGAEGVQGSDGRDSIVDGDPADSSWGHYDMRRGGKGRRAGDGGEGGDAGMGGIGGGAGNVFIENIPETAKQTIKKEKGAQGEDGDPGAGGAGGAGKPDGLDCLYIKGGGWFFKKRQQVKGYELHCINNDKDREKESWKDGITLDATIRRNQGVAKDKGKKASEQNRRRNARAKNDLKRELFNTNLANHLHTKSAGSKAFAFNDVSDRLARAREAEETLQEELSVKQKKIRDIEHLQQTTSTLLQQTQAQKSAVIQHSRLAQFNKVHKEVNLKKEVEVFFKISAKDKENRLPFHTCSPVLHQGNTLCIHDLEVAMHGVNTTHGQNMHALAELIKEIILFSGEECLPEKRALLIKHLVDIIRKVPLRNAVKGFKSVLKAMKDWDVEEKELLQAVTEKHQQVVAFQADLDVQKLAVNQAFNDMVHEWTTQAALLKFLVKDNLLFKAQTKKLEITEKEQRLKWFQKRLYQKILFFMEKGVIDRSNKEIFFRFAMEKVEELELALKDDPSPSRRFREFLRLERKQIREKANNLKKQQEWLIQHLPEILEANTSSAELPKALLERLSSPEDVYVECSRLWAKIPSFNHENNVEDSLLPEEELPTREFSIKREGEQWESHLKQLLDLEKVLGDLDPYIVALDKIYSDSETKDSIDQGLADLFISLVDLHQKLDPCLEQLEEVKTNDLHKIYSLRLSYASSFSKKPHPFYANALGYLQRKNILLTKNECWENLRLLDDENEKKRVDSFLHEILLQADQLYRTMQFIEPIDFLTIAKEVLIEDPQRFLNDAVSSSEIYPSILQKAIKNDTLSCKDPQAMMKCFESALEHGEEKTVKTCLFVLLNISLSYAECTRVLTLLSKHKSYQEAFELFGYKIGQQKRFFEIKWKKALEAAKTYDHLRRQVDKEDQGSIVALLKTIAKEATLFSSDEQIDILETIVKTISQNGCFSTLDRLKALKKDLITKIGVFPIQDNPKITQYNQLLKDEKEELEKLSDAFLQVLEQPYQQEFLIPSLIAIQHLPFETKQLLVLYEIIQSFPKSSEGFRAVQKKPFFFTDYLISPEGIRHKKLLTAPDGNCLVHAVFGCPKSGVVLSNSSKKRKEIESRILQALSNQELPSHVKVKSFSPNNQVVEETINIRFLAQSIAKDGEWLGLDHAELIAYLYSLNILVYNERTKEYIGLFYNSDPNQIDRLISYNGINHWSKHQMITISEPISESKTTADSEAINTPSSPLSEKESEIKEDCLQTIRVLLINALQINCQTIQQAKRSTSTDLLKKKTDILQRARSIVENTQLLHTERHLAQFDLWMTLLDYHFDIDTFDDETGVKRQKLYEDALERLTHELGSYDSQEGIDHFHCWLRNTLSKIKGTDFSLDHLKVLLRETKSQGSSKQNASKNIKQGYWRGLLPYSSRKEEENSIVKVVEEANVSEEIAKLVKFKFDEGMIHEECSTMKSELQEIHKEHEGAIEKWIKGIQEWLKVERPGEELQKIYPHKEQLTHAINYFQIPQAISTEKKEETAKDDPTLDAATCKAYIQEIETLAQKEMLFEEDMAILHRLKSLPIATKEMLEKITQLEIRFINLQDKKDQMRKEKIDLLIEQLLVVNGKEKIVLSDPKGPFEVRIAKSIERLRSTLCSGITLMGEEYFFFYMDHFIKYLKQHPRPFSCEEANQLFWVLPRLDDPAIFFQIMKQKLSENWAITLLERHCLEAFSTPLSNMALELPSLNMQGLENHEKEERIQKLLEEKSQLCTTCLTLFKKILKTIRTTQYLKRGDKENLLRLLADRLVLFNQEKLNFSLQDFISLLENYLIIPQSFEKVSQELSKEHSPLANLLFQPSFETFKYALKLAWIQGSLEPALSKMDRSDKQKLIDSLFEIETMKKEEQMRQVVDSLKGDLTPAVAECVFNFAQGSFELDSETLSMLKNRSSIPEWYSNIQKYTGEKRSQVRTLEALVALMDEESNGINSSIKDLLSGDVSVLFKAIKEIEDEFALVKDWPKEKITEWAIDNKGEHFFDDPKNLIKGIAIFSRANQITEKFPIRHTQMIALWLMLRKGDGNKGKIAQMSTGEGKSIAFAGLAILRAMAKSPVSVITTSWLLAKGDAEAKKEVIELFDMTVSYNCDPESEADDEIRKACYYDQDKQKLVDIVYGDVGSFERDLLLTEFHGKEIIPKERLDSTGSILVDEVDGLFLDNAGMVLYLSHNVDTLRFLERIFGHIWALVNHSSFQNAHPFDDRTIEAIHGIIQSKIESKEIVLPSYRLEHAAYMEMENIIKRKLNIWIRSALQAKMLRINNEYIIYDQGAKGKEKKSITVMDKGTGLEQLSLKWSNGLHQFLQFKHGLELAPDSLKAVFLSNYFFFKSFAPHIYGLSGTLGSSTEQTYLQDLYQVDLFKIPRFKGEKYIQYKAKIAGDSDEWLEMIGESMDHQIKELKRAALVLCESVEDALKVQESLSGKYPLQEIYTSSFQEISFVDRKDPKPVSPGDLITATNLAGRGTDFKTTELLEAHRGLHVVFTFRPPNIRIQEQGFRRTARAGNEGSGEFIIIDPQRRSISELCRIRDMEEKQRLESVAIKEVKKIEFENELLRGFYHKGNKIDGFQSILESIQERLKGEVSFYQEAQLNSLKNRWAFWLDHMEEKISLVHVIGKEAVVNSFKEFQRGVEADFNQGDFRLIKEPIELIKLGGEYRKREMWSRAGECYKKASKDPHYKYAIYYEAACQLIQCPTSCISAREKFKKKAKKAALAIKPEISHLQTTLQNVSPLVEQRRMQFGEADYGNPYKARTEEKIQIWSIFLSAIDDAIGGTMSEEQLKKSEFVKGNDAKEILESLGDRFKKKRVKKNFQVEELFTITPSKIPKMFIDVVRNLPKGKPIDKSKLKELCRTVTTQKTVLETLGCPTSVVYKVLKIPPTFKEWPEGYTEAKQFIICSIIDEIQFGVFESHEAIKAEFVKKIQAYPVLQDINIDAFFAFLLEKGKIGDEKKIDLSGKFIKKDAPPKKHLKDLHENFTDRYAALSEELQHTLLKVCAEKVKEEGGFVWCLNSSIYASQLSLPASASEAAELLWDILEDQGIIKESKIKLYYHNFDDQVEGIEKSLKDYFRGKVEDDKFDDAIDSILGILKSSFGMIYQLDDKKATAEFADIIRKYYHDHSQHAPEGLHYFIELGLEVIATLIEKKQPPAWFEVLAVTVMGVVQMVAGAIIKAYLPVVGELIGNALMSSGMDDVMFAISSAVNGHFTWSEYGKHKVESLKRSIISSAISCGVSFGVNAIGDGIGKAWEVQKLSGAEKLVNAGKVVEGSFNIGSYVLSEVGRSFINMGISQIASRGLSGMASLIAGSYEDKIREGIQGAVDSRWHQVQTQADALFQKLHGDGSVTGNIQECLSFSLKKMQKENGFDSAIRASKQLLPHAGAVIGNNGWSQFLSHATDLANLGVSISKLVTLVEDNVNQFSRQIRETKDRKEEIVAPTNVIAKEAFDRDLENKKKDYVEQLVRAFNGLLDSAVYSPLVSLGTQELMKFGQDKLIPLSEQEMLAQSRKHLSMILEAESNVNNAFFDGVLRDWRGATDEVENLTEEELKAKPVNGDKSIQDLKNQYGSLLKVYKDKNGHIYVQRPNREEYAKGILEGKASGAPEFLALSKIANKDIAIKTPDGKMTIYHKNGTVEVSSIGVGNDDAIYLKLDNPTESGIGHVTLEGAGAASTSSAGFDCLYEAIAKDQHKDVKGLREAVATTLQTDETCKLFYHSWSLNKEPKVFVGKDVAKPANPLTSEEVTLKHAKKGVKKIIIKKGTAKALEKVKNTFGETVSKNVGAGIKGVGLGIKLGEKLGNDPSLGEVANFAVDTALDKAGEFVIKQGSKGIAYLAFGGSVFATNTIVVVATGLLYSPPLYEKNEAQTLECIRAGGGQSCNDGTYFEKAFEKTYGIPYTPPPLDIRTQILQRLPIQTTGPTIGPHNPNLQEVKHWWR